MTVELTPKQALQSPLAVAHVLMPDTLAALPDPADRVGPAPPILYRWVEPVDVFVGLER